MSNTMAGVENDIFQSFDLSANSNFFAGRHEICCINNQRRDMIAPIELTLIRVDTVQTSPEGPDSQLIGTASRSSSSLTDKPPCPRACLFYSIHRM